ncbi:MAG TPA: hypothetical protein PKI15_10880, partial [Candidatus Cloacimonadota bacterium]|nr:hypothetical protein [Candidatus Cloacimonadota bacterium]
ENWEITSSLYEGASEALTLSGADPVYGQGMAISKRYHPNLYTWTGATDATGALGLVAASAGLFPTAQRVRDAAKNMNYTDHTTDLNNDLGLTSYTARAIRNLCIQKKVRPLFTQNGKMFWGAVISSEQADTLRSDSKYIEAQKTFQTREYTDNPYV